MTIETPPRVAAHPRWWAGAAAAAAPLVVTLVTYRLWRDRLPDPMPSHWNASQQVDGTSSLTGLLAVACAFAGAGLLVALIAAAATALRHGVRRVLIATGAGVAAIGGGVWLMTATVALDIPDARQVPGPSWQVLAFAVALFVVGAAAYLLCPPAPPRAVATDRPGQDSPRVDLQPGERAVYTEVNYAGRGVLIVLGLSLLPGIPLAIVVSPWAASPLLITVALVAIFVTVRVTVDANGLRAGFGPWGWPRVRVPLREIAYAEPTTVQPVEWGGWGYRIRPDGARGLIMRRGPGVQLTLSEGRIFVASVQDPDTVAGLVNTLRERGEH